MCRLNRLESSTGSMAAGKLGHEYGINVNTAATIPSGTNPRPIVPWASPKWVHL
jgi:hypothetical protein